MNEKAIPPYPHRSWLGTWTTVGRKGAVVPIHMRQVARHRKEFRHTIG